MRLHPEPSALTPLAGRQAELDAILGQLDQAARGLTRIVMAAGEPGIGKSRLLDVVAARAADAGAIVLRGGASEAAGMPPYLPFLEVLGEHILATDAPTLREQAGPLAQVLTTILPELAVRVGELPTSYVLPPEQARLRLFEAVDRFLEAIAGERLLVLLLDDLQWADAATLELLCHIARRHRRGAPLSIVGAYRTGELAENAALQGAVTELNRLRVLTTIALHRLCVEDVAALAASYLGGTLAPAAAEPLFTHSEGSPFFVEELLLVWLDQGVLIQRSGPDGSPLYDLTPSVALPLPPGIVAAVHQRLARLAPEVVDLLGIAAVVGRGFDPDRLAAVAGLTLDAVEDRLVEAVRAQLVRPAESGTFAFSHDKIRECLYQELPPSRRRRLHTAIGEVLEADSERSGFSQPAELAFHFAQAGDAVRGATHAISAAEQAMRSYAPSEAAGHFRTALELLAARDPRRGRLQAGLGDALLLAGAEGEAVHAYDAARAWFEAAGDPGAAGEAALSSGRAWWRQEQIGRARSAFEEAAALLVDTPGPVLVAALMELGSLLAGSLHQYEEGIAHTRRALGLARSLEDDGLVIAGTRALGNLLVRGNDLAAGISLLEEALALATALGNPFEAAECCAGLATAYLWHGDAVRSQEVTRRRLAFAERCHDLYQLRHVYTWLAFVGGFLGEWADVDTNLGRAQTVTDDLASPEPQAFLRFVRGVLALGRNEPAEAERHFQEAIALFRVIGPDTLVWYLPCLGLAQALQGHADEARACVAEAEALLARVSGTTMAAGDVLAYLAWIDLVLGDRDRLRSYPARLAPFQGQFHDMLMDRLLGEVALALGDRESAGHHLRQAETTARQQRLPLELARVQEALAAVASADRRRGLPAGLTAREAEVLRLVVGGLSNRQIAAVLTVTEKTVENHLTSAYGKIGADNRAAASAFAVRHGLA